MGINMLRKSGGEIKCVIVGDGGVGKTSMLMAYTTGAIMTDYIPTCFDAYTVDVAVDDKVCAMSLIDTAGQETYDRLRTLTYYDTDVFLICFSVEDPDSFDNVKSKWLPEIRQYRPETPFILVGTQTDLRGSVVDLTEECVTEKEGRRAAKKHGAMAYCECSALEGVGLDDIFKQALKCVVAPKTKHRFWKTFKSSLCRRLKHKRRTPFKS